MTASLFAQCRWSASYFCLPALSRVGICVLIASLLLAVLVPVAPFAATPADSAPEAAAVAPPAQSAGEPPSVPAGAPVDPLVEPTVESTVEDPAERPQGEELLGYPIHQFLAGVRLGVGPAFPGSASTDVGIRDIWALDVGRLRISSGGGGGLLKALGRSSDDDSDPSAATGSASLSLIDTGQYGVKLGLRLFSGRKSGADNELAGVPGIRRTVLARISTKFTVLDDIKGQVAVNSDMLGHGYGSELSVSFSRDWMLSEVTTMGVGLGITIADRKRMRALFGVPADASAAARLGVYLPGAGPKDLSVGFSITRMMDRNWVVFGGISMSGLLGRAADSPIVSRTVMQSMTLGAAYRCC